MNTEYDVLIGRSFYVNIIFHHRNWGLAYDIAVRLFFGQKDTSNPPVPAQDRPHFSYVIIHRNGVRLTPVLPRPRRRRI